MKRTINRDKSHEEQIERWAEFVRNHPEEWKSKIKPFIDGQILMARRFYANLLETPDGLTKILELRGVKI